MRFLVTTRRSLRQEGASSALAAVSEEPDVKVVSASDPNMVTIEANDAAAGRLRRKLELTHYVEPEIRRGLHS